jgi:hypothetical protein
VERLTFGGDFIETGTGTGSYHLATAEPKQTTTMTNKLVRDARANGHTWHEIADTPGTKPTTRESDSTPNRPSRLADGHTSTDRQPHQNPPSAVTSHRY